VRKKPSTYGTAACLGPRSSVDFFEKRTVSLSEQEIEPQKVKFIMHQSFNDDNNDNDIIIHDDKQGTCMLIDVAIPGSQKCDQETS